MSAAAERKIAPRFVVFKHNDPPGSPAQGRGLRQSRAAHGAQHAARQMEARQLREHGILRRENGHVRTEPGQNFPCGGGNVAAVHQGGHGHTARVERASDDEGALRDEQGLRRVLTAAELHLGQAGVDIQLRGGKFGDLDQIRHAGILSIFGIPYYSTLRAAMQEADRARSK